MSYLLTYLLHGAVILEKLIGLNLTVRQMFAQPDSATAFI